MRIEQGFSKTRHPGGGRPNNYAFHDLSPGGMLVVEVLSGEDPRFRAIRVSNALSVWKRRNNVEWETSVRTRGNEVHVFRFN